MEQWWYSESSDKNIIPSLGYIEGFDKYFVYVHENAILCCESGTNVTYQKLGELPAAINIPDYELTVNSTSITDFSFVFSNPYTYKAADFSTSTSSLSITWAIISPDGVELVMPNIPNEILDRYSTFSIENLNFGYMSFFHHLDDYSYLDAINNKVIFNDQEPGELIKYQIKN